MKYCKVIWLTDGRCEEPATENTLFTNAPKVQCPGCTSATVEGPKLNLPCPSAVLVSVGRMIAGPKPQINLPGFAGERKKVGFMSPKPNCPPAFWVEYGCHTIG